MEFWKLVSLFRGQGAVLEEVLREPEWTLYQDWYEHLRSHVQAQNRAVLDAPLPEALWRRALARNQTCYYVQGGFLRPVDQGANLPSGLEVLSSLEAFERFGAGPLEDAEEYGSAPVA